MNSAPVQNSRCRYPGKRAPEPASRVGITHMAERAGIKSGFARKRSLPDAPDAPERSPFSKDATPSRYLPKQQRSILFFRYFFYPQAFAYMVAPQEEIDPGRRLVEIPVAGRHIDVPE